MASTRRTGSNPDPQLRLFMTPKEIVNQYQVLDGDREEYQGETGRGGELTGRSRNTQGGSNYAQMAPVGQGAVQDWQRTGQYFRTAPIETDEQVFQRKSMEAQMDPDEYAEFRGENLPSEFRASLALERASAPRPPSSWGANSSRWDSWNAAQDEYLGRKEDEHYRSVDNRSIWDSVRQEGVQQPITLGLDSVGSQGKQEILGGHHRLASALDTRPNDYVPVVYSPNIWQAKADKGQKYT